MKMRYRQAIGHALADEMESDDRIIILGEDVGAAGGAFKVTEGLQERFGSKRVIDTPISETAILGAAVGAAVAGLRPVAEMMFVEFAGVALDQIVTEAATVRYLSRGQLNVPMVLRTAVGGGQGFGAQHSQVLDHWFTSSPGLKVAMPADAHSAYHLTRLAIRDDDPVVVLEHKALYGDRGDVDLDAPSWVVGQAETVRAGDDVTIVAAGAMVTVALAAAESHPGWSADVIDLRWLRPWDVDRVLASVARTGVLVTVEEAGPGAGWGAQVSLAVCQTLWSRMKHPPLRVTTPDAPVPHTHDLERRFLPNAEYVVQQVSSLLETGRVPLPWWEDR